MQITRNSDSPSIFRISFHRFYLYIQIEMAVLEYSVINDQVLDFYHTYTPPSMRGKGIADKIAKVLIIIN